MALVTLSGQAMAAYVSGLVLHLLQSAQQEPGTIFTEGC